APLTSATDGYPHSLAVGDFDGDGNPDLAIANIYEVKILLGDGTGRFMPASGSGTWLGGSTPQSVAVGDFNGDGLLDLGVNSYEYGAGRYANVLLGNGNGSFSWEYSAWLGQGIDGRFAAVADDLNGDDFDDFVTVTAAFGNAYVHVLLSDSSGGLQGPSTLFIGEYYFHDRHRFFFGPGGLRTNRRTDL